MKYYEKETISTKEEYFKEFDSFTINKNEKYELALQNALDLRKFEIDMYWKRASYFWTFIALTFTSYFIVLTNKELEKSTMNEIMLLLTFLGLFLSIAWYFVNKGSKHWQENWEKHVDMLEDEIMGPLYKTIGKTEKTIWSKISPFKSYPFSVSKINQLLSLFIIFIWVFLTSKTISNVFQIKELVPNINTIILVIIFALFLGTLLFSKSISTHKKNGSLFFSRRGISDKEELKVSLPRPPGVRQG